ncbi:hypothetical protein DMZ43_12315 [Meridianimaribacter sp. CL38]|uniref:hypothetical protein n=1 Tax=Meridianimaribacter sp. CL38 TaxID=2213021 RepID=UPI0010407A4E|nr:hypothetical protein [Meridianimaribacter sp. CL38]TBV25093.1 hypothetical protein DMZ43_12315 [Meridianimaribacter sp. CL38]
MSLYFPIKTFYVAVFVLFAFSAFSQSSSEKDSVSSNISYENNRQRFGFFSMGYHNPNTTGDNFMGDGLQGKSGFDFKFQMYVYKQFFLGLYTGASYFDVKDVELVGNYKKSTLNESYLYIGYEFLPADRMRLGALASFYGDSRFKNYYSKTSNVYQVDKGNLNSFGVYFNYELSSHFMIYIDYAYRTTKTEINTSTELNQFFEKGKYHSIGIGLIFALGSKDVLSTFID